MHIKSQLSGELQEFGKCWQKVFRTFAQFAFKTDTFYGLQKTNGRLWALASIGRIEARQLITDDAFIFGVYYSEILGIWKKS